VPGHDLEGAPRSGSDAVSGYSGGSKENPTYLPVTAGWNRHLESVQVRSRPTRSAIPPCCGAFWRNVDPLDGGGSSVDVVPPTARRLSPKRHTSAGAGPRQPAGSGQGTGTRKQPRYGCRSEPLMQVWPAETYSPELNAPTSSNQLLPLVMRARSAASIRSGAQKLEPLCHGA